MTVNRLLQFLPAALALVFVGALVGWWLLPGSEARLTARVPGTDQPPGEGREHGGNPVLQGRLTVSGGQPSDSTARWPEFRGVHRNGISLEQVRLAREWPASGPRQLWAIDVGEGYAGPVVADGRVYLMDYDAVEKHDALRALSLADGREIWRYSYPIRIKRNHGMSRTVPTVASSSVVAMGPKCHVLCVDATTGEMRWGLDLVGDYGATVPPWYTGQCPLVETNRVILAPGGPEALLLAVDLAGGQILWKTPNPRAWKMTHASIMPMEFAGRRMYVYPASGGVVGVSASDGSILWETDEWKISFATVPSPVVLEDGRIFLAGGYDAGSLMLRLEEREGRLIPQVLYRLDPEVFGATQQTPILFQNHLYGVRPDPNGDFACLDLDGGVLWTSGPRNRFGLGPFLIADGLILALNDSGRLSLMEATPTAYRPLAEARILDGRESWGPLALVEGKLLARDLKRMVCLDLSEPR